MPRDIHWHASIENIALYTVSAIIGINVLNIVAAKMAGSSNDGVRRVGEALGAITPSIG